MKMHLWRLIICFAVIFLEALSAQGQLDSTTDEANDQDIPDVDMEIADIISAMTLEQKIGQLFLVGFQGSEVTEGAAQMIRDVRPGGIILFGRNIKTARQTARLINQSQTLATELYKIPLLVAVDQEGGVVSRIKLNPPFPSALSIGTGGNEEITQRMGYYNSILLKSLGFNMNLAPVVDIISDKKPTFIGNRAFGLSANDTIENSKAFAMGQKLGGIMPTLKHFPGHGAGFVDSHVALPTRMDSLDEMLKTDLLPYKDLSQDVSPEAIMVAHIAFPKIDPSGVPAAFSKIFLQDILRKKLNFDGIVITDDIEMAGASVTTSLGDRALKSIEAGADMIMVAWNRAAQKASVNKLINAVKTKQISEARINNSLERILNAKRALGVLYQATPPNLRSFRSLMLSNSIGDLSEKILETATLKSAHSMPPRDTHEKLSILNVVSSRRAFHSYLKETYKSPTQHFGLPAFKSGELISSLKKSANSMAIVHITSKQVAAFLNYLPESLRKRVILVNGESPGIIESPETYKHVFNIYTSDARAGRFLGSVLKNYFKPSPVSSPIPDLRTPASN
jgi:beta-N-acetylhexosaminidase